MGAFSCGALQKPPQFPATAIFIYFETMPRSSRIAILTNVTKVEQQQTEIRCLLPKSYFRIKRGDVVHAATLPQRQSSVRGIATLVNRLLLANLLPLPSSTFQEFTHCRVCRDLVTAADMTAVNVTAQNAG
jgi:hypothetical protein